MDDTSKQAKMAGEILQGLNLYKNYSQLKNAQSGRNSRSHWKHINRLFNSK